MEHDRGGDRPGGLGTQDARPERDAAPAGLEHLATPGRLEALFREEQALMTRMLAGTEHAGRVGAFEGAGYEAQGLYRPSADCIMFTRDEVGFCPVCSRAIARVIGLYTR